MIGKSLLSVKGVKDFNKLQLPGINSLRFLAFLLVFCSHLFPVFEPGHSGVQFFFILSSFLLTYLALKEIDQTGSFNKLNFFIRRSLRIYPLYFLVLLFAFFLLPFLSNLLSIPVSLPERKWMYWVFLSNFDYSSHVFFLKLLWSIAVEEQFYIAFLLFSFAFKKYHYTLCLLLLSIYLLYLGGIFYGRISNNYFNPLTYLPCFISGMLIAKLYVSQKKMLSNGLVVYGILAGLLYSGIVFFKWNNVLYYVANACAYSALLILILTKEKFLSSPGRLLFRFTEKAGQYTYGLYVYSGLAITLQLTVFKIPNKFVAGLVISLVLATIAITSYHLYELPFLKLKKYFRPPAFVPNPKNIS